MLKEGDKIQFASRKKKTVKAEIAGVLKLLGMPQEVFLLDGIVSKVKKEVVFVKFSLKNLGIKEYIIPREFIKPFELESNHPITRIFL